MYKMTFTRNEMALGAASAVMMLMTVAAIMAGQIKAGDIVRELVARSFAPTNVVVVTQREFRIDVGGISPRLHRPEQGG